MNSAVHLSMAYICLSCESVTDLRDYCPICGDRHLWPLQNWLGKVGGNLRAEKGKGVEGFSGSPAGQAAPSVSTADKGLSLKGLWMHVHGERKLGEF